MIQKLRKNLVVGLCVLLSAAMVSSNTAGALDMDAAKGYVVDKVNDVKYFVGNPTEAFMNAAKGYVVNKVNDVKYFVGNQTEAFWNDPIEYALCDIVADWGTRFYILRAMKEVDFKNNGLFSNIGAVVWRITIFSHPVEKLLISAPCLAYRLGRDAKQCE